MKSINMVGVALMAVALGGCGSDAQPTSDSISGQNASLVATRQPLPTTSGTFHGHYVVPAPSSLVAAARYSVDAIDWSVDHGIATLRYYLPMGLVGGSLEVEFGGSLRAHWIRRFRRGARFRMIG